jgi:hypothetical protein
MHTMSSSLNLHVEGGISGCICHHSSTWNGAVSRVHHQNCLPSRQGTIAHSDLRTKAPGTSKPIVASTNFTLSLFLTFPFVVEVHQSTQSFGSAAAHSVSCLREDKLSQVSSQAFPIRSKQMLTLLLSMAIRSAHNLSIAGTVMRLSRSCPPLATA